MTFINPISVLGAILCTMLVLWLFCHLLLYITFRLWPKAVAFLPLTLTLVGARLLSDLF